MFYVVSLCLGRLAMLCEALLSSRFNRDISMLTITSSPTHIRNKGAAQSSGRRGIGDLVLDALRRWGGALWLDPRSRYLSAAEDHEDLERRLRMWEETTARRTSARLVL